jgi:hypothetical protein
MSLLGSRGRDLLNDILGKDFRGVLVSDCLAIYDDTGAPTEMHAHHHKAIHKPKTFTHKGRSWQASDHHVRAASHSKQKRAQPANLHDLRQALQPMTSLLGLAATKVRT